MASLLRAPTTRAFSCPSRNTISVGMLMTPYFRVVSGLSSTLSLAALRFCALSRAISSTTGETMWQGTHHSAQKSTRTGRSDPKTRSAKSWSDTCMTLSVTRPPPPTPTVERAPRRSLFPSSGRETHVGIRRRPFPCVRLAAPGQPVQVGLPPIGGTDGGSVQQDERRVGIDPLGADLDTEVEVGRELVSVTRGAVPRVAHQPEDGPRADRPSHHDPRLDLGEVGIEAVAPVHSPHTHPG